MVTVTDGEGQRVSSVFLGQGLQIEEPTDHVLDLSLGGRSVSHHCSFDLERAVLRDLYLRALGSQQGDAPGLTHGQGGPDVLAVEDRFDRYPSWMVLLQECQEVFVE